MTVKTYLFDFCHGSTSRTSDSVGFIKVKLDDGLFHHFYFTSLSDLYAGCRFLSGNVCFNYVRFAK